MHDGLVIDLIVSGMLFGTPVILAALGELLAERSGVLNLGIEGMMLVGAATAFWTARSVGGAAWVPVVVAMLLAIVAGGLMASIHAFVTVTLKGNQIVSGVALTIFGGAVGLSSLLAQKNGFAGESVAHALSPIDVLGLASLPIVGPILFHQNALVYASWVLAAGVAWYLRRTRAGLHLRAVGESPSAADAMGVSVTRYRWVHTMVGGCFAGLAGAAYSLAIAPSWTDGMTAGAGWIAIALVILAFWQPGFVLVGGYLFGVVSSLGVTLQARGVGLPPEVFSALPYIATVVVLALASSVWAKGRFGAPAALGDPYVRGET